MIKGNVTVKFDFDEVGAQDLEVTLLTLMKIREEFEGCGTYNETEITALQAAEHIINEIQRGETF